MSVTIYHNPDCGTSRNTLAMVRQSGVEPTVIEYLKTPPSRQGLKELISAMGISVRALLRQKGTPYKEFGLDDPKSRPQSLNAEPNESGDRSRCRLSRACLWSGLRSSRPKPDFLKPNIRMT